MSNKFLHKLQIKILWLLLFPLPQFSQASQVSEPVHTEQKLQKMNGVEGDSFGRSTALSDRFSIVGVVNDDTHGENAGAVIVYQLKSGIWQEFTRLYAGDPEAHDQFGMAVSFNQTDTNLMVVGSVGDDDLAIDSGAVYVFHFDGTAWNQIDKIIPTELDSDQGFGQSLSYFGDQILIGAPFADIANEIDAGAAYLFEYNKLGQWHQIKKFNAFVPKAFDYYSYDLILSDNRVLISVPLDDGSQGNMGSIYFYKYINKSWTYQQQIIDDSPNLRDEMGWSISLSGNRLIAGVQGKEVFNNQGFVLDSGLVNVFEYDGALWIKVDELIPGDVSTGAHVGEQVGLFGNVAIISRQKDSSLEGAVYIFKYVDGGWVEVDKIKASDASENTSFGSDVAVNESTYMVAASGDDQLGLDSGSVYMYQSELIFKSSME